MVRISKLRKMREVEQVAAVCYRSLNGEIEFLLVQTRGSGRWTFPKGGAEAGLTHAQAAAIEASEEAGVHGKIEEASFARYSCRNSAGKSAERILVSAHLCEVTRLTPPKEAGRNRTWFSAKEAQAKLREGRKREESREFVRVVEKAVNRIRLLSSESVSLPKPRATISNHEWNRVEIEPRPSRGGWAVGSLPSRVQRLAVIQRVESVDDPTKFSEGEVIPFRSVPQAVTKKFKALAAGTRVQ
jgi:8-oxo-dGTP pyrophosphatase MutT (NUDIX family)